MKKLFGGGIKKIKNKRGWGKEVMSFRKIYKAPGNGTNEQMLAQKHKSLSQHKAVL